MELTIMSFPIIIGAIVALFCILCSLLLWSRSTSKTHNAPPPPEAGGARPVTGHLHLMARSPSGRLPHFSLASLADRHGPMFTIRLGARRAVVVSSWELAKELFTTCDVAVSSRPTLRSSKYWSHDFGLAPYGPYWRAIRKLVSSEVLSNTRVQLHRSVRVSETAQSVKELYKIWEGSSGGGALVDMKKWLADLNLNVILRVVAGKRFHGGDDGAGETQKVILEFFRMAGQFLVADSFPWLGWLDVGGHEKKLKRNANDMDRIMGGWLAEHREKEYSGERDFMEVIMSVMQGNDQLRSEYDGDKVIKATCQALILGGTDSTTVMLVWAVSLLLNNRNVMKKAQRELDQHVGNERRVEETDIGNLVYLQAVLKETLRLYPAGPLGGTRVFSESCDVGGYRVEKGTWLIVNLWKLHRDPRVWGDDVLEFKPERFLGTRKDLDVRGPDFQLIPFGAGRRLCPGSNFGLQMIHLVLANLLHAFELSTVSDEAVDMSGSAGLTNMKVTPLDVLVTPRLPQRLY